MTVMKQSPPDLAEIEAEARARLEGLHAQEATLSLDALTDEQARTELADVESQIRACEQELHRAALAGGERQRREAEAAEQAERQRVERLMRQADKLAARIEQTARLVDETADAFAVAVGTHRRLANERQSLLQEAGVAGPATSWGTPYEDALRFALGKGQVDGLFAFLGRPVLIGPLLREKT